MEDLMDIIESSLFLNGHEVIETQIGENEAYMIAITNCGKRIKIQLTDLKT